MVVGEGCLEVWLPGGGRVQAREGREPKDVRGGPVGKPRRGGGMPGAGLACARFWKPARREEAGAPQGRERRIIMERSTMGDDGAVTARVRGFRQCADTRGELNPFIEETER